MPDFSQRVRRKASRFLESGEEFVLAVAAHPRGSTRGTGQSAIRPGSQAGDGDELASRVPTSNGYLTLTSERLLWIRQSKLGLATGDVLAAFALDEVAGASWPKASGIRSRELLLLFGDESEASVLIRNNQTSERLQQELDRLLV